MSGQPFHEIATLQVGEFQADYCPRCHHMDLQCGDILAMTPDGVQRIGGFAVCAECGHSPHGSERPSAVRPEV